jgi:hypothetical protein
MERFAACFVFVVATLSVAQVAAAQATCSCSEEEKQNCFALGKVCSASGSGGGCQKSCVDAGSAAAVAGDQCQEHGFGCGSCVADGVWGALWINADCTRRCDKVCGDVKATDQRISVIPKRSGPELVPAETPVNAASQQQDGGFTNAVYRPSQASHDSAWCGVFGPSSAEITCPGPKIAHCWCDPSAGGLWGIAKCECQAPPATPATTPPPVQNCSIPLRSNLACPAAGLLSVTDPGCSTNCVSGYKGVCRESTCTGNTWTQSTCECVPR